MANIIGIEVSGETYDLEDTQARQDIQTNSQDIDGIEGKIPSSASTSNKLATENDIPSVTNTVESGNNNAVSSDAVFDFVKTKQYKGFGSLEVVRNHVYLVEITWAGATETAWMLARVRVNNAGSGEVVPIVQGSYSPLPTASISNGIITVGAVAGINPWIYATAIGDYWG